tara:strand:- start:1018 stop:1548 length:531 start_codon:yes stop_codon:yes gene_type:complete
MSKKKTSTFYLTERLTITDNNPVTATIDLGAYVDVADRQAIAIEEVDFIVQGTSASTLLSGCFSTDAGIFSQVSDLNRGGTIQFCDDRALVASAALYLDDTNNVTSNEADMFPDVFGARDGVRLVVNDQLYLTCQTAGTMVGSTAVNVTVRIKAHVCGLTAKDWMAIAIQSTAADN